MNTFLEWAISNKLEFGGTIFGFFYVWFSIRQNLLTWPAGIVTSILYFGVFLNAGVYAAMGLQLFYLFISCYGWLSWSTSANSDSDHARRAGSGQNCKGAWANLPARNPSPGRIPWLPPASRTVWRGRRHWHIFP